MSLKLTNIYFKKFIDVQSLNFDRKMILLKFQRYTQMSYKFYTLQRAPFYYQLLILKWNVYVLGVDLNEK